jgi:hypothetical protein
VYYPAIGLGHAIPSAHARSQVKIIRGGRHWARCLSLTIHTDSAASKSIMWRQCSLSRSESPGCELVLSGRRTSITPAYQPANLARDPIGSGEGRRNTTNSERRSPAPEHAEHHKSLGEARFGRHEAAGGVERAGVEEEAKAHAHREVDRRICGPTSPAHVQQAKSGRIQSAYQGLWTLFHSRNEARQAAATGRKR